MSDAVNKQYLRTSAPTDNVLTISCLLVWLLIVVDNALAAGQHTQVKINYKLPDGPADGHHKLVTMVVNINWSL